MKFDVWMEGYAATGNSAGATFLGTIDAESWREACREALIRNDMHDLRMYHDLNGKISYWGCRLYDNEREARMHFG